VAFSIKEESMIIVMKTGAREEQIKEVIQRIEELGYKSHVIRGTQRTVMGAVGDERGKARLQSLESMPGVESVVPFSNRSSWPAGRSSPPRPWSRSAILRSVDRP